MTITARTTTSADGSKFNITHFVPLAVQKSQGATTPDRAVIYAFGGGSVAGSVAVSFNIITHFTEQTEYKAVLVFKT